jgi:hypothetical protein
MWRFGLPAEVDDHISPEDYSFGASSLREPAAGYIRFSTHASFTCTSHVNLLAIEKVLKVNIQ